LAYHEKYMRTKFYSMEPQERNTGKLAKGRAAKYTSWPSPTQ
jgi:hypothetical protein